MNIPLFILWALVGWSAYTPNPDPVDPPPDLPPGPCRACGMVLGAVAGIVGGWGYTQVFSAGDLNLKSGLNAATTAVGAFFVARFVTGIYRQISNRRR